MALAFMYIFCAFIVSIEIGCYLVVMAFIEDIKNDVSSVNKKAKTKKNRSSISRDLRNLIQFHTRVKELSALIQFLNQSSQLKYLFILK